MKINGLSSINNKTINYEVNFFEFKSFVTNDPLEHDLFNVF